jgi:predicted nicotinamide N-methyase
MARLSTLIASDLPSESTAVQQKTYVTFTCLKGSELDQLENDSEKTITLLERRYLISGSNTTGFRTWEAALHLGSYLLSEEGRSLIKGKNVLELGAGTGFLSLLCAKHLEANHVTSTDGDEQVVEALKENAFLNELHDDNHMHSSVLRWGRTIVGSWVEEDFAAWPYDVVIGADIVRRAHANHFYINQADNGDVQTYEKMAISALAASLRMLFQINPNINVLIAGAVRNWDTFNSFVFACGE